MRLRMRVREKTRKWMICFYEAENVCEREDEKVDDMFL